MKERHYVEQFWHCNDFRKKEIYGILDRGWILFFIECSKSIESRYANYQN